MHEDEMKRKAAAWLQVVAALGDTIREVGRVPSGHLYAASMGALTFEQYTRAIDSLKRAKLIEERSHELIWIGPDR